MNKRKTILHIIDSLARGGAETLLLNTVNELTGYNHVLVYLYDIKGNLASLFHNVIIYNLSLHNNLLIPYATLKLRKIIRKHNPEIVHAHLWKSILIARLATPKNVRLLFTLHNIMSKDAFESKIRLFLERKFYNRNQELIAVSETVQRDYLEYILVTGKKNVLYNFIDNKFFSQPGEKKPADSFRLISVGNLKAPKNYPFLLKALRHVKDLKFTFDIYGEGPQADLLKKKIYSEDIPVRLMGIENKIETVLPGYDLFVMASSNEGYGIALAEAMASGLPVLISDIPVFREIAGNAAFYFSLEDETDFSFQLSKIHKLHQQGSLLEFGNNCRNRAMIIASKANYFKKLESIYSTT